MVTGSESHHENLQGSVTELSTTRRNLSTLYRNASSCSSTPLWVTSPSYACDGVWHPLMGAGPGCLQYVTDQPHLSNFRTPGCRRHTWEV